MSINELMNNEGPSVYYTDNFRNVIMSHLKFIREHPTTSVFSVEPQMLYKYENDLFGLLAEMRVPYHYHWIIMQLNGFESPLKISMDDTELLIPSSNLISNIEKTYVMSSQLNN